MMGSLSKPQEEPRFLVIGAGSRGNAYAQAVTVATPGAIAAIAELDTFKRHEFGKKYIWGRQGDPREGQEFANWVDWIAWETQRRKDAESGLSHGANSDCIPITGVFICTLDHTHADIIRSLAPLNLHILCEKPLATSLGDCLSILSVAQQHDRIFSIGHVLRYSPHNTMLRRMLVEDGVLGEIISVEHTEPVGWWHFAHSYVRGNWRRSTPQGVGSLLTKSCHDVDFLLWLLCSPSPLTGDKAHLPTTITSSGALTHFRRARKPKEAGNATNCLNCAAERDCIYSAKQIYRDRCLRNDRNPGWPLSIVLPEIEDIVVTASWARAEDKLMSKLAEDYDRSSMADEQIASRGWYGRCVYESDNDVVDEQTVTFAWEDDPIPGHSVGRGPKTAILHMTYPTSAICERRGRVYGSRGEMTYDSQTISVHTFADGMTRVYPVPRQDPVAEKAHGGGDFGLTRSFVEAVRTADSGLMSVEDAQTMHIGCNLEEIVRSHAAVFAAEEARQGKKVVNFPEWWNEQLSRRSS